MKILFIGEGGVSDDVRIQNAAREINKMEYAEAIVEILPTEPTDIQLREDIDVLIYSRPHEPKLLKAYKQRGAVTIVDVDDHFRAIPKTHPGYEFVGKGRLDILKQHEICMMDADLLTVSTRELAKRFDFFNRNIQVIPNGWSADNPYWKRFYPHDGVHIGWAGTITHREDFKLCLSALLEVTRRYPEAKIFIGGDVEIYQMLKQVPEKQKFFLPMMTYEDYPHMLGFFDILIAPLIDDEFNRAKSDIKLVDAGAKGIPWVASSIEFYREWKDGGYIAGYKDDWIQALSHLVRMPGHREDVGEWGHKKALTREMGTLVHTWIRAIEFALENKK